MTEQAEPGQASPALPPYLRIAFGLFVALTGVFAVWPVWRALFLLELTTDETWNAYQADAVLTGQALYPPAGSLITNNYPPVSFYVIAGLARVLGADSVFVGRGLSLFAIAVTAVAIGVCVRQLGGGRAAAALAGLWFVATMARFFDEYAGVNDPHIFGVAVTVSAFAWFLRRERRGLALEPAVLGMALAGFIKQTLIATPLAALLWIAAKDRRRALRAALVGAGACAAGLALCAAVYGLSFISQLLFYPREYSLAWAFGSLGQLQFIAPAGVIWAIWAWQERQTAAARFTALYIAGALLIYVTLKLGRPIGINAQFELAAAVAIGLGIAFDRVAATPTARRWGAQTVQLAVIAVLAVRLLLWNHVEVFAILASSDYRRAFTEHAAITQREADRVRALPGNVYCNVTAVCRWAGKPFVFDPYAMGLMVATGRITEAELWARVGAARLASVTVDPRTEVRSLERKLFSAIR